MAEFVGIFLAEFVGIFLAEFVGIFLAEFGIFLDEFFPLPVLLQALRALSGQLVIL